MANNSSSAIRAQGRGPFQLVKWLFISFAIIIILVGLVVFITWLVLKPRKFIYSIDDGWIQHYGLSNNHLNSTFDFVIIAENPNHRVSVYYDTIDVSVLCDGQSVASKQLSPFFQPKRNITRLPAELVARNVALSSITARDFKTAKVEKQRELGLHITARIRLKVGAWKSNHRTIKILCSPVMMHFSGTRKPESEHRYCDVDM